ncbi:MAG: hypothetical protein FVQ81_12730 [Candidatus Glassbacteria bacterium]|nr:hypothetical protein [Candidatus Glassbacteria bacterium]
MATDGCLLLESWRQGVFVYPEGEPGMRMFLWFYEWNLFGAVNPGHHTSAFPMNSDWSVWDKTVSADNTRAVVANDDIRLELESVDDGVELILTVRNTSGRDWPDPAAIIPCFNPGPPPHGEQYGYEYKRNREFADLDSTLTWFAGPGGLTLLDNRSIHFNHDLRESVERARRRLGGFEFDSKWASSPVNSHGGLLIRESAGREWVTGIAWERHLSAQGHNPWLCMHLSANVGPLKRGERIKLRGRIYLFRGSKEDCYNRYLDDFQH